MDRTLLREWYVVSSLLLQHFTSGIIIAFPAILTPSITGEHSDIHATREEASWIAAMYGMTGPIGFLVLPPLMQMYGRKLLSIVLMLLVAIGSVIIALAPDVTTLVIGRSVHGLTFGGVYFCCIVVAEYTHPKRRGFFMVFKMCATSVGEMICHSFGSKMDWRQVAWFSLIPAALGALITATWPESPAYLAYQGRYDECTSAFEWLRGKGPEAKKELRELMLAQQQLKTLNNDYSTFMGAIKAFRSKDFLKPCLIGVVASMLVQTCGVYFLSAYAVEIMIKLSGDASSAFYYILGFDFVKLFATILSSVIVRYIKRRLILFVAGSLGFATLALVCVFHYIDAKGILHLKWLMPSTLILYYFLSNVGIIPVTVVIKGEVFPLQYRGIGVCTAGVFKAIVSTLALKFTSVMIRTLDLHGMFAVYLVVSVVLLMILYFVLPENKDKTLQNIENDFIGLKIDLKDEDDSDLIRGLVKKDLMTSRI